MFEFKPRFESKDYKSFAKNLKSTIGNMKPVFDSFGRYIEAETNKQFQSETNPDGDRWAPLSPVTLLKKKSPYILRETLAMFKSFYYRADADSFEYGLNDFKYKFHHYGTKKMPARVVVGINDERKQTLNKSIILYLKRRRKR